MSIQYAEPNEIVEFAIRNTPYDSMATTIIKTPYWEMMRLILPAGEEIPTRKVPGPMTLLCIEGQVAFTVADETRELTAGHLFFLHPSDPHSLTAIEDSTLLLTLLSPYNKSPDQFDVARKAFQESIPANAHRYI